MECTGRLKGINQNWQTGQFEVTFAINEKDALKHAAELDGVEKLNIKATKYRKKRSLDSNAYAWALMQKIAEAIRSDKWEVYLSMLQLYSRAFVHVIVKPEKVDTVGRLYRTYVDLGEVTVNGKTGRQLQVYLGSSQFDSEEMSVFIEGIVNECKDLGIETLPPEEIARMNASWRSQ